MKSARIASSILKILSLCLGLSQLYLQQGKLSFINKAICILACAILCFSLMFPALKELNICLLLQAVYISYLSFIQKKESMSMMNEDQIKHIFLLFFVMFNAVLNDYKVAAYTFYKICIEFRFIVMSVFNFSFILVTGILSFFITDNIKINSQIIETVDKEKKTQ